MPQECMRVRVFLTASTVSTGSPVKGLRPPLAKVAAITAPDSAVISMEHNCGRSSSDIKGKKQNSKLKGKFVFLWQVFGTKYNETVRIGEGILKHTYLKVKIQGLVQFVVLREAFVFPHEIGEGEVTVGTFLL